MFRERMEQVLSAVLTVSAVAIAISVAKREFSPKRPARIETAQFLADWQQVLPHSILLQGRANAPIQIIELADFECPSCGTAAPVVHDLVAAHPDVVSLSFVHLPLTMLHRFALPAARLAECAHAEGRFPAAATTLFALQDSLGLLSWGALAHRAGLADTARASACAVDAKPVERINAGLAFAKRMDIRSTPTFIVNGWRLPGHLSAPVLDSVVAAYRSQSALRQ